MTSDEAWLLTPAKYAALSDRFLESRRFIDFQIGWMRQLFVNANRDPKRKNQPFKIEELCVIPSIKGSSKREMPWEEQLDYVKNVLHPQFSKANKEVA